MSSCVYNAPFASSLKAGAMEICEEAVLHTSKVLGGLGVDCLAMIWEEMPRHCTLYITVMADDQRIAHFLA